MEATQLATPSGIDALADLDWAFVDEPQAHPIHGLHPYPAKFVPALPRRVIETLSDPGDLVMDPFAGSGTALVEALLLGRRAIGGDLNPVALVAARAKTQRLTDAQLERLVLFYNEIEDQVESLLADVSSLPLPDQWEPTEGRRFKGMKFWFSEQVAHELSALKLALGQEPDPACGQVLDMCLSAIVVSVSWQDSDTRYVRRDKSLPPGTVVTLYKKKLTEAADALKDAADRFETSAEVFRCDARAATFAEPETVRLVVTSPPYPNAWSYHLYHQNRILWLGEDPWEFKEREIGHHRSYSATNGEGAADFQEDMRLSLEAVRRALTADGTVVVVVGDSIVRGELVRNDRVVIEAAQDAQLELAASFKRIINPKRKAFNPVIGKIKAEHVLVFNH